jgi:hypothetical protein
LEALIDIFLYEGRPLAPSRQQGLGKLTHSPFPSSHRADPLSGFYDFSSRVRYGCRKADCAEDGQVGKIVTQKRRLVPTRPGTFEHRLNNRKLVMWVHLMQFLNTEIICSRLDGG